MKMSIIKIEPVKSYNFTIQRVFAAVVNLHFVSGSEQGI